jgi:drug/metabolite transporter (DMT)-like permease
MDAHRLWPGVPLALGAALLFGASTPLAKPLLGAASPWLLAGILYLGAGAGTGGFWLAVRMRGRPAREVPLRRRDLPWLAGAVAAGGVLAPVALLLGLREASASAASLLLNLEGVFTVLIAWTVFRENVDWRIGLGAGAILLGAALLTAQQWQGGPGGAGWIAAACLLWAVDNSLSRQISGADPLQIAALKGGVAGIVNTTLALRLGAALPAVGTLAAAAAIGAVAYGLSLALYVAALRHLGSARTAAYFSLAPFVGAGLGVLLLGEAASGRLLAAGALMAAGLYPHLAERHEHLHGHDALLHEHAHTHDAHHRHGHAPTDSPGEPHSHVHVHPALTHRHPHYPDLHHRHGH